MTKYFRLLPVQICCHQQNLDKVVVDNDLLYRKDIKMGGNQKS